MDLRLYVCLQAPVIIFDSEPSQSTELVFQQIPYDSALQGVVYNLIGAVLSTLHLEDQPAVSGLGFLGLLQLQRPFNFHYTLC